MSNKYIAYVIGKGEDCDYTIGCNRNVYFMEADTESKAREAVFELLFGNWDEDYEEFRGGLHYPYHEIEDIRLIEVSSYSSNLMTEMLQEKERLDKSNQALIKAEKAQSKEELELLEHERLRAKFETQ